MTIVYLDWQCGLSFLKTSFIKINDFTEIIEGQKDISISYFYSFQVIFLSPYYSIIFIVGSWYDVVLTYSFVAFHQLRIPRENLLNKTGDVTADGEYVTPYKVMNNVSPLTANMSLLIR